MLAEIVLRGLAVWLGAEASSCQYLSGREGLRMVAGPRSYLKDLRVLQVVLHVSRFIQLVYYDF